MKLRYIFVFFISIFFSSCENNKINSQLDNLFTSRIFLEYEKMPSNNYIWGTPMDMLYCDSAIMVFDEKSENGLFHLINLNDLDSIYDFGKKGQGIGEFIMPFDFQLFSKSAVSVYDLYKKTLSVLNIPEIKNGTYNDSILIKDTILGTIKVLPTVFNTFVSLGFYEDCMFKLWGAGLIEEKRYAEYPYRDKEEQQIANNSRGMAYQGIIRVNSNMNKFVYAVNTSEIIYFYKIDTVDISLIKKYEISYPVYKTQVDGDMRAAPISSLNESTFISLCVSPKYVYALYSGKNFKEKGLEAFTGTIIYQFDWDGNAIKKYELNIPVTLICVDDEDKALYAFSNMPDPELIRFKLKYNNNVPIY